MSKVWFITGSSRGLGRDLAEAALAGGDCVVATARQPDQLQALVASYPDRALALDVTRANEARAHAGREDDRREPASVAAGHLTHGVR